MNCNKLNNKGFSLVEILVAVSIIGIISAIAIPAFQDYRTEASKVAADTTISNIHRAFNNCLVLKKFGQCNSLGSLGINCSDCDAEEDTANKRFCAEIDKEIGSDSFKACVSVQGNTVTRNYGGGLLGKLCKSAKTASTDGTTCSSVAASAMSPVKVCTQKSDCGSDVAAGVTTCGTTYTCDTNNADGECDSSANCT